MTFEIVIASPAQGEIDEFAAYAHSSATTMRQRFRPAAGILWMRRGRGRLRARAEGTADDREKVG